MKLYRKYLPDLVYIVGFKRDLGEGLEVELEQVTERAYFSATKSPTKLSD